MAKEKINLQERVEIEGVAAKDNYLQVGKVYRVHPSIASALIAKKVAKRVGGKSVDLE